MVNYDLNICPFTACFKCLNSCPATDMMARHSTLENSRETSVTEAVVCAWNDVSFLRCRPKLRASGFDSEISQ